MLRKLALAACATLALGSTAQADQWVDTRNGIALGSLPQSSEYIARLNYARIECRARLGTPAGMILSVDNPLTAPFLACMQPKGYALVRSTPAEIAAAQAARDAAAWRSAWFGVGQAISGYANSQPTHFCTINHVLRQC
jgi:hypothetical protein